MTLENHDQQDRYCEMVFVDSHDAPMEDSELPETRVLSDEHQQIVDGGVTCVDLDVGEDRQLQPRRRAHAGSDCASGDGPPASCGCP